MAKILVSDPISDEGLKVLTSTEGMTVDVKTGLPEDELVKIIGEYDALLVRSGTKVTAKIIEHAKKLKVIGRAGVGVDNVDVASASKRGIVVMNTPGGNTLSTAEHTMALMLALVRKIGPAYLSMRNKQWDRKKFQGMELFGKTIGIIGLGRIGTEVAKRSLAFGMKVIAYDPFISTEKAEKMDVEVADLDKIFSTADIITVHTHITSETKSLIGKSAFDKMKKGVCIINCARGGIVSEQDLYDAIKSGKVAGAALDVYESEPPADSPLFQLDAVLTTPHLGASTKEAQENVAVDVAYQVIDVLKGGPIRNAVNVAPVDTELLKVLEPFMKLGEKLGRLLAQLLSGQLEEIKVRYSGEVSELNVAPITVSVLRGILGHVITEPINYVNAPIIAKDRGIKVIESKSSVAEDYADLIYVTARTTDKNKEEVSVGGTWFGKKKEPRVVRINDYHVDAIPEGYLLVLTNEDKPGIIGSVGVMLGNNNINIAGMTLGRKQVGGNAVTVLNIDGRVPEKVLAEIAKAPSIVDIKMVEL
jgi:D-3-phosphoglycerate dehydrogenase